VKLTGEDRTEQDSLARLQDNQRQVIDGISFHLYTEKEALAPLDPWQLCVLHGNLACWLSPCGCCRQQRIFFWLVGGGMGKGAPVRHFHNFHMLKSPRCAWVCECMRVCVELSTPLPVGPGPSWVCRLIAIAHDLKDILWLQSPPGEMSTRSFSFQLTWQLCVSKFSPILFVIWKKKMCWNNNERNKGYSAINTRD